MANTFNSISFSPLFMQQLAPLIPPDLLERVQQIRFDLNERVLSLYMLTTDLQHALRVRGEFAQAAAVGSFLSSKIQLISNQVPPQEPRIRKRKCNSDAPFLEQEISRFTLGRHDTKKGEDMIMSDQKSAPVSPFMSFFAEAVVEIPVATYN